MSIRATLLRRGATLPFRVWVNQPSTAQVDHKLHGRRGIAVPDKGNLDYVTLYFCGGELHSTRISTNALELSE